MIDILFLAILFLTTIPSDVSGQVSDCSEPFTPTDDQGFSVVRTAGYIHRLCITN